MWAPVKHLFLYQQRWFTKLGKFAASLHEANPILKMLVQKVTEINQLVEACKIYLASEIFKTELEGLAFFTHHVTFPFLHWVKKSTQDKLLVILPKLFKDLKDGKMDILSKFLVTMRQVPVHKPSTELGINDAEACPRGHWHPGCVSNLFVSFNNLNNQFINICNKIYNVDKNYKNLVRHTFYWQYVGEGVLLMIQKCKL